MEDIKAILSEIRISLLQLQRSALIDTQTLMQLLIDKGVCTLEDIVDTRSLIECKSEDVKRIDEQIVECGGQVIQTPQPEGNIGLKSKINQLKDLLTRMQL